MTIEEKARAYDEALNRCKEWASGIWGHSVDDSPKDIAEFIFPQLAESDEDAKIRKALIEGVSQIRCKGDITREQMLAYLEKQKEPENISASTMIPSFHEELTEFELVLFNAVLDNNFVGAKGSENALAMTKKVAPELLAIAKNEMKPDEWDKREKLFTKALQTANAQIGQLFEENKKLKEQQPTEIDEYKIIKKHITEDSLSSEVNKRLKECGWYVTDTESSEWSEDDEKDIAHIIRVLDDCYAYGKHDLSKTDHENLVNTLKSIHPQLKSEWSEEDEGELQNAIDALEFLGKKGTYKSESGYDVALKAASWLKSLPERFNPQPKQEWSEEDEKIINTIISLLGQYIDYKSVSGNSSGYAAPRYGREIDWLKSLRPQPKQEWSEEDERIIDTIVSVLGQYIDYKIVSGTGSGYATPRYNKEIAWLKSLPLDLKKKNEDVAKLCSNEWNEEDEEKLKAICTYLRDYSRLVKLGDKLRFNEYCDFLESLRPQGSKDSLQTHWKPSEEQMNALLKVVYKARELHYTSIDGYTGYNDLRSLYEQLKKLM